MGKIAIANSKIAFDYSNEIFSSDRWNKLLAKGARVQRLLWASTSTKNPNFKDTIYIDELIGKDTVNTMPPATIDAFVDHGIVKETLSKGIQEAKEQINSLKELGINLDLITHKLQVDGVKSFSDSFSSLLKSLDVKIKKIKEEVGV
jgi:transaldolase